VRGKSMVFTVDIAGSGVVVLYCGVVKGMEVSEY